MGAEVDKAEYDPLMRDLQRRHDDFLRLARTTSAPHLQAKLMRNAARVNSAIDKVEQQYRFDTCTPCDTKWEADQEAPQEAPQKAPLPDGVWDGLRFHCPICNAMGVVTHEPRSADERLAYCAPVGHPDLRNGKFACLQLAEARIWRVSRFQNRSGGIVAIPPLRSAGQAEVKATTWIEHHDRLVTEWFDGERQLVDDLYPTPDVPVVAKRSQRIPPSTVYTSIALVWLSLGIAQIAVGSTFGGILWLCVAIANLAMAFILKNS